MLLGLEECSCGWWLVSAVMAMYDGASTVVRTLDDDSYSFEVEVGLHQGSMLCPLLFIIVGNEYCFQRFAENISCLGPKVHINYYLNIFKL